MPTAPAAELPSAAHHSITSGQVWTTALVLMAFGGVLARVGIMQYRRLPCDTASGARL
jgi:hypothetical protein